jgi:hypothetical protein
MDPLIANVALDGDQVRIHVRHNDARQHVEVGRDGHGELRPGRYVPARLWADMSA